MTRHKLTLLALLIALMTGTTFGENRVITLRILTYNIHSAYNSQGAQDPEAIARVIEASGADAVALQEVSRGWLLDGSTDLATFLARRLKMQVLFQGTADPARRSAHVGAYGSQLSRRSRSATRRSTAGW